MNTEQTAQLLGNMMDHEQKDLWSHCSTEDLRRWARFIWDELNKRKK